MPVWTLVIGDQPTYAFAAANRMAAKVHLEDQGLKDDLSYYENYKGHPLWDGEASLSLRLATPTEYHTWKQAQKHPSVDRTISREDSQDFATYLVSVHDPADDDVVLM